MLRHTASPTTGNTNEQNDVLSLSMYPGYGDSPPALDLAFAPSDCHAYLLLPIYDGGRISTYILEEMGEVLLFSMSSHRDKFPVSRLGRMLPIGFTAGRRTVAGTIGLALWDRNALRNLSQLLFTLYPQLTGRPHADEFPPVDIVLSFVNESGNAVTVTIHGVTFLDEGVTLQMDDSRSVVTLSYMAVDYDINYDPIHTSTDRSLWVDDVQTGVGELPPEVGANLYELDPNADKPDLLDLALVRSSDAARQRATQPSRELHVDPIDVQAIREHLRRQLPNIFQRMIDPAAMSLPSIVTMPGLGGGIDAIVR